MTNTRNTKPTHPRWQPPLGMDPECIPLCTAINRLPGLHTYESCCGHGNHDFWVFLMADSLEALPPLAYYLDPCHCGRYNWQLIAYTDCAMSPIRFRLEGPPGPKGYEGADHIAELIEDYLDWEEKDAP